MKRFLFALVTIMFITSSCSLTSTVGNGKIDPIEAATINLAVSIALQSYPDVILPAYGVATALLALLSNNTKEVVSLAVLDDVLRKETDKLNLDPLTKQAFNDLVTLIKLEIENKINIEGMTENEKLVVVMDVVKIVHQTTSLRLQILQNR